MIGQIPVSDPALAVAVSPAGPDEQNRETCQDSKTQRPEHPVNFICPWGGAENEKEKNAKEDDPGIVSFEHGSLLDCWSSLSSVKHPLTAPLFSRANEAALRWEHGN